MRSVATVLLLLVLTVCIGSTGCKTTPQQPEVRALKEQGCSRNSVLLRQIARDSVIKATSHPVGTVGEVAHFAVDGAFSNTRDFIHKRLFTPLTPAPPPLLANRPYVDEAYLNKVLKKQGADPLQPASIAVEVDGKKAIRNVSTLIDSAQHHISVLMYLWDSDALGWAIARHLAFRAKIIARGCSGRVTCRVLVDGGGNLIHSAPKCNSVGEVNEALSWLGKQPHVKVVRGRNALGRFDHRKLMLIDDTTAWSGGRNFTLASFFEYNDLSYTLTGPLIQDMIHQYEKAWKRSGGRSRKKLGMPPIPRNRQWTCAKPNAMARIARTEYPTRDFRKQICVAIDLAKHHIYIENPYLSSPYIIYKLVKARQRGVDVRVVMAEKSQSDLIDQGSRPIINRMRKAGIRVYIHPGTTHAKVASVDAKWTYIGTGNLDALSLGRNYEVGLAIAGGPVAEQIERELLWPSFHPEWEVTHPLPTSLKDHWSEIVLSLNL